MTKWFCDICKKELESPGECSTDERQIKFKDCDYRVEVKIDWGRQDLCDECVWEIAKAAAECEH